MLYGYVGIVSLVQSLPLTPALSPEGRGSIIVPSPLWGGATPREG